MVWFGEGAGKEGMLDVRILINSKTISLETIDLFNFIRYNDEIIPPSIQRKNNLKKRKGNPCP